MILLGAPAFLLNNRVLCFVRNDGGPKLAMAAMLAGSFSNVLLDYLFIFPLNMGIFGAVLATCMAPVIGLSVLSSWFFRKKNSFHLCRTGWAWSDVEAVSALGASALVTEVSAGVVMVVFNLLILSLEGEVGVAAYGVIANLSLVTLAVFTGLGQGAQPLVSQCCGRGEADQARRVRRCALVCAALFSLLVYLMIFRWTGPIASAFNSTGDGRLQRLAEAGLRLYFIALPFAGFNAVTASCLSAMDRPQPALTVSLLRGLVLILPLALLFARLWGMTGVWLSFPATEAITAGTALLLERKDRK